MAVAEALKERGWNLSEDAINQITENGSITDLRQIHERALDTDLREISVSGFPEDLNKTKYETIPGSFVVQIQKIRNISAPKANEDSKAAPRMLKLSLTDGLMSCQAVEVEYLPKISLDTPPGTKLFLKGDEVPMSHGYLLLKPSLIEVLGGKVPHLVEKWELNRTLAKHTRGRVGEEGGPPPWIPFGQKILKANQQDRNFKSLEAAKDKENRENAEFEAQRKDAIAEAARGGAKKIFGGGNKPLLDHNVQQIVDYGFTVEQAEYALRQTRNNVGRALKILQRRGEGQRKDDGKDRPRPDGKGKGGEERERKKRGEKGAEEEGAVPPKPSGKVQLFAFLEDKLPVSSEKEFDSRNTYSGSGGSFTGGSSATTTNSFISEKKQFSSEINKSSSNPRNSRTERSNYSQPRTSGNRGGGGATNSGGSRSNRGSRGGNNTANHMTWNNGSEARSSSNPTTNTPNRDNDRGRHTLSSSSSGPPLQQQKPPRFQNQQRFQQQQQQPQYNQQQQHNQQQQPQYNQQQQHNQQQQQHYNQQQQQHNQQQQQYNQQQQQNNQQQQHQTPQHNQQHQAAQHNQQQQHQAPQTNQQHQPPQHNQQHQPPQHNQQQEHQPSQHNQQQEHQPSQHNEQQHHQHNQQQHNQQQRQHHQQQQHHHQQQHHQQHHHQQQHHQQQQLNDNFYGQPWNNSYPEAQYSANNWSSKNSVSNSSSNKVREDYANHEAYALAYEMNKGRPRSNNTGHANMGLNYEHEADPRMMGNRMERMGNPRNYMAQQDVVNSKFGHLPQGGIVHEAYNNYTPQPSRMPPPQQLYAGAEYATYKDQAPPPVTNNTHNATGGNYGTTPQNVYNSPPNQYITETKPWRWQKGDKCLAKYWEDDVYYNAEVTGVSHRTCVVRFVEYGNFEEVLHDDCIPITEDAMGHSIVSPSAYGGSSESLPPQSNPNHFSGDTYFAYQYRSLGMDPLHFSQLINFQYDGMPANFSWNVHKQLFQTFSDSWEYLNFVEVAQDHTLKAQTVSHHVSSSSSTCLQLNAND